MVRFYILILNQQNYKTMENTKTLQQQITEADQAIGKLRYRLSVMTMLLEWELEKLNPCEHFNSFMKSVDEKYNQLSQ